MNTPLAELEAATDTAAGVLREAARRYHERRTPRRRQALLDAADNYCEAWAAQMAGFRAAIAHTVQPWVDQ